MDMALNSNAKWHWNYKTSWSDKPREANVHEFRSQQLNANITAVHAASRPTPVLKPHANPTYVTTDLQPLRHWSAQSTMVRTDTLKAWSPERYHYGFCITGLHWNMLFERRSMLCVLCQQVQPRSFRFFAFFWEHDTAFKWTARGIATASQTFCRGTI